MSTHQDINALRAQRFANTQDPLALMANTQTPFHPDHSSHITYMQHPQPNNNFVLQPSFNTNYLQHPMQNPIDISNPTTAFDMALELILNATQNVKNQYGNGNVVIAPAEGNGNGINGNPIRCYNYRGEGHYASNYTVKPRKRDVAYLQTQLQIAQKDKERIQLNSKEFDFMAAAGAYDEIEKVTSNCNLQDNL
ncbi:hypothetical protein Tco_0702809 [Tanacetum coccineum]|uniref:Uncharacterized protein n=1 Tax=Tanacetum coccineum TaxID=301880 RepID=A0ABQ4XYN5_9ASTR